MVFIAPFLLLFWIFFAHCISLSLFLRYACLSISLYVSGFIDQSKNQKKLVFFVFLMNETQKKPKKTQWTPKKTLVRRKPKILLRVLFFLFFWFWQSVISKRRQWAYFIAYGDRLRLRWWLSMQSIYFLFL